MTRVGRFSVPRLVATLVVIAWTAACSDPSGLASPRALRVDAQWVTGEAAAAVDPGTGLFRIDPAPSAVLTRAAAESVAVASIRFGLHFAVLSNTRASLEADRGAPIAAWDALRPCGRTMLALTPFGPAPAEAPRTLARFLGSAWSVTLCGPSGDPQVALHISDAQSGARFVGEDFNLADIDSLAQMYISNGLPRSAAAGMQPSPEAVVGSLFAHTGVPISLVPRPRIHWFPPTMIARYPMWQLELTTTVTAQFDGGQMTGPFSTVYGRLVAPDSVEFFVPSDSQPATIWAPYFLSTEPAIQDSVAFAVVRPIVFRRVRFP